MPSRRMRELSDRLREALVEPGHDPAWHRANFETMSRTFRPPDDVEVTAAEVAGVPCEWVTVPEADRDRVCLYLHGGGYVIGGLATHRELAGRYARALGARTLVVDYRLAPETPCPGALEDAIAVYASLLEQGFPAGNIAVCGESAGGGLSIALLTGIAERGLDMPAGCAVVSPWVDLTFSGASYTENRATDPLVVRDVIEEYRAWYAAGRPADDPLISPVFGDLSGLPPVFVTASRAEMLRDDAALLARRLEAAGVTVTTEFLDGAVHAWTLFPHLPETQETVRQIAAFVAPLWGRVPA